MEHTQAFTKICRPPSTARTFHHTASRGPKALVCPSGAAVKAIGGGACHGRHSAAWQKPAVRAGHMGNPSRQGGCGQGSGSHLRSRGPLSVQTGVPPVQQNLNGITRLARLRVCLNLHKAPTQTEPGSAAWLLVPPQSSQQGMPFKENWGERGVPGSTEEDGPLQSCLLHI